MMSSYERIVYRLLIKDGIKFTQEKQFKDMRNGLYRIDFWIPSMNIAIEVQGAQHYEFTKAFFKNKSDFTKAQERDRQKISYCLAHDIKLYCIPYWDIKSLNSSKDLFKDEYLAKSKFHNDETWRQRKRPAS